ncbi:MAG: glycoside hydrolase family 15 protein [Thermoleophilia bacterium]|nr:glycoside hydrolase family 15 protein [Thermoleophilia bacterium]
MSDDGRVNGYAPIRDYAVIGDGRTAALVARDGSIDWLCLPNVDSPSVFGRLLDAEQGGAFTLAPEEPFAVERRYAEGTNVLETTFRTASGVARVTDALAVADRTWLSPLRELVRRVEGLAGRVAFAWRVEPRFGYAGGKTRIERRAGRPVALSGREAVALGAWGAGEVEVDRGGFGGRFELAAGETALLDLDAASRQPLVLGARDDTERRLARTVQFWRDWSARVAYDGPWKGEIVRSALALKLLVFTPSGAIVAAPTTSLPEWIGGERNWDYRYTWIRDAAYTVTTLLQLGFESEAEAFLWWLGHATAQSRPELKVLYRVDGDLHTGEEELELAGYRGSRPVRVGNGAAAQTQLDVYGAWFESIWLYAQHCGELRAASRRDVGSIADWVCEHWRERDAGIWEVRSAPAHFVQSKAMCWVALDRACKLADRGLVPDRRRRWRAEADAIRAFVDAEGWDDERGTYVRATSLRELDASLLTLALFEYSRSDDARLVATVDAVRRELAEGPLVCRYRGEDGLDGNEGFFLPCSFWLVGALAKTGRVDEAAALMGDLVSLANDVGLYSEEMAADGTFLGNFPQALVHLALVTAAVALERADAGR